MNPNRNTYWKRYQPPTLRDALKGCKDFATERHNLSVERIAEKMGIEDHWSLYKYIANARMPAVLLAAYQNACGIDLVTRWMAATSDKLLVDLPKGHAATMETVIALGGTAQEAVRLLAAFYAKPGTDPTETLNALREHLTQVAYHHANVVMCKTPEFDFGGCA